MECDMGRQNKYKAAIFLFLLAAFLGGMALPEAIRMGTGNYSGFLSLYSFQKYEQIELQPLDLCFYLMKLRIITLLFLWMSTYTAAGILFHLLYALWLAVSGGMLLALFVLKDGREGLLLLACCLLPQWILYAAVIKQETELLLLQNFGRTDTPYKNRRILFSPGKDLLLLGKMLLLCACGCICEAFLGTWTIKIFLQLSN